MNRDEKRTAVVLAASKGLGRACAETLARQGWNLVVCSRTQEGVSETTQQLEDLGARAVGVAADVRVAVDVGRVFIGADEHFGRVDALVCNAGGPPTGNFLDLSDDTWKGGFDLTLMSAVRAIRQAIPRMRAGGYGRLLILGSSSVRRPLPNLLLSNVYRPALAGLIKSLAVELGPEGITANMVSPGRIDTQRVRELDAKAAAKRGTSPEQVRRDSEAAIPMGRYGEPSELANAVAFLASEQGSYITGQSLLVDGGLVPTHP